MGDISTWNPVDNSNTTAPPDGWPEGMAPNGVNNSARAMMGAVRRWYDTVTAQLASITTSLGNYVLKSGGTMTGTLSAPQYNLSGVPFANTTGSTIQIYDPTGVIAIHLQASNTFLDADNFYFRNNAGAVSNMTINSAGDVYARGLITGANVTTAGTVTAAQLTSTGNINAANDITSSHDIWASVGTVTAQQLTSTIHINAGGTVTAAQLTSTGNVNATSGTVFANIINGNAVNSNGDMSVGGSIGIGATVIAVGNIQTNGNVLANTGHFTLDGLGGNTFGFYNGGASNIINFAPSYYFSYVIATGELAYTTPVGGLWYMRPSTVNKECFNNIGPVGGNGAYFLVSDRRLKEAIEPSSRGLAEIVRLDPVTFQRVNTESGRETGFIAQDVEAVLPEAVRLFDMPTGDNNKTTPTLAITDTTIVAALVNAVKELHTRLSQLETQNNP